MEPNVETAQSQMSDRVAAAASLEKQASWLDRLLASRNPNHWLNDARRTLMAAEHGLVYSCQHGSGPAPCARCFDAKSQ